MRIKTYNTCNLKNIIDTIWSLFELKHRLYFTKYTFIKGTLVCYSIKIIKIMKKKLYILNISLKTNSILCSITDLNGDVLWWISTGVLKNRSSKRMTLTLIQVLFSKLKFNKHNFYVAIKGINNQKLHLLKILRNLKIKVLFIEYLWKRPHNGCKEKKNRRL